jgi:DNA-binding transcriptional MerR regulator
MDILISMQNKLFSQSDLAKIFADVKPKTLFSWLDRGLYEWAAEESDARGKNRSYTLENVVQVGIVKELAGLNLPLSLVKAVMDQFFHKVRKALPLYTEPGLTLNEAFSRALIIGKYKQQRYLPSFPMLGLKKLDEARDFLNQNPDLSTLIVVNVPAIKKEVEFQIERVGLKK